MKTLKVIRHEQNDKGTWGRLELWDGQVMVFTCHSMELPWLDNKPGKSCIPKGEYEAALTHSPAFGRELWLIKGVEGRSGIRIHAANYVTQLRGCIAPGMVRMDIDKDGVMDVGRSKEAEEKLHAAIGSDRKMKVVVV